MDKKIVGVIGAITGLAAMDQGAQATPATQTPDPMNVRSYAELLDPIPNALAALRAADMAAAQDQAVDGQQGNVQVAGYHHHHHSRWRSRWWHHHHHHHHHRVIIRVPGIRFGHHHHHHHHHHHFLNP
ncbi:MAG TPA: hypothetical protein VKX28_19045 [Xanthobacteraceae bacterium]|nr:hypothetical protein [Xanthobacteraceae bacterium]